jgi:hypothetical protein
MRRWIPSCVLLLFACLAANVAAAIDLPLRRWAVLVSKDLRQTGLDDLLTVELSKAKDIELVERAEHAAITRELELEAMLGSGEVSDRLKLGRLLKADALLMISRQVRDKKPVICVVIAECDYGTRLCLEYREDITDRGNELVRDIVGIVQATRRRFAGGIRQIVGVTHFVSKNLTHDFDYYQAGFAHLLESALIAPPGVAVIETEEARAISEELQAMGDQARGRVVPVMVQGEFETVSTDTPGEVKIILVVHVSRGGQAAEEVRRDGLSSRQVVEFLTRELPRKIAHVAESPSAVSLPEAEQATLLKAQASQFSKLGFWTDAIGLREAALLLTPDDIQTRLGLIDDYHRWHEALSLQEWMVFCHQFWAERHERALEKYRPAWDPMHAVQYERLLGMARHVEYVVRSRKLSPGAAAPLVRQVIHDAALLRVNGEVLQYQDVKQLLDPPCCRTLGCKPPTTFASRFRPSKPLRSNSTCDGPMRRATTWRFVPCVDTQWAWDAMRDTWRGPFSLTSRTRSISSTAF